MPKTNLAFDRACPCAATSSLVSDEKARQTLRLAYYLIERRYPIESNNERYGRIYHGLFMLNDLARQIDSLNVSDGLSCAQLAAALDIATNGLEERRRFVPELVDAAVETGLIKEKSFAEWYRKNRDLLLKSRATGRSLIDALRNDSYRSTLVRVAPCRTGKDGVFIFKIDTVNRFCLDLLTGFLDLEHPGRRYTSGEMRFFLEHFAESAGFEPVSLDSFSVESLTAQLEWFGRESRKAVREDCMRLVSEFYRFLIGKLPDDQNAFTYETGLVKEALVHQRFPSLWLEGYRSVMHNPLDPPPAFCKWMLFPNESETSKASFVAGRSSLVDLETHPDFQQLLINWIWMGDLAATSMRFAGGYCKPLIEAIANIGIAIISEGHKEWSVSPPCVATALAKYSECSGSQMRSIRFWIRSFLEYGQKCGVLRVDRGCFLLLDSSSRAKARPSEEIDAVPKEQLIALAKTLEERSANSLFDELIYAVFCTQALTSLRVGEILTLKVADVAEGVRPGIYAVRRSRKADGADSRDTQIPKSIFDLLMAVITTTEDVRANAPANVRDYVFIKQRNLSSATVLRTSDYRTALKQACESMGIGAITPSSVRKRYMTEVVEQGIRANLSRLAIKPLTGHSSEAITNEYYLREDIRHYLEAVHGIEIGKPRIAGDIVANESLVGNAESDVVEGGAGICRNEYCNIAGTATCLLCRGFMTAPRFIPQMEEALAIVQRQIENAPSEHDREHLVAVKRLHLAYLGKMMELAEDEDGN